MRHKRHTRTNIKQGIDMHAKKNLVEVITEISKYFSAQTKQKTKNTQYYHTGDVDISLELRVHGFAPTRKRGNHAGNTKRRGGKHAGKHQILMRV
jgi:hypothetical protein